MLKTWKRETEGKVKFKERSEGIRLLALKMEKGALVRTDGARK